VPTRLRIEFTTDDSQITTLQLLDILIFLEYAVIHLFDGDLQQYD